MSHASTAGATLGAGLLFAIGIYVMLGSTSTVFLYFNF